MLFWFNNRGFDFNFIQFYFDSWVAEIISTAFQCCPLLAFCLAHMSSGGHPPCGLLWSCVCLYGVCLLVLLCVSLAFLHLPSSVVVRVFNVLQSQLFFAAFGMSVCSVWLQVISVFLFLLQCIKGRWGVLVNEKQVHSPKQTFQLFNLWTPSPPVLSTFPDSKEISEVHGT